MAPLDNAHRAVRRLLASESEPDADLTDRLPVLEFGGGVDRPVLDATSPIPSLYRVFAFVDVCGFTGFTDRYGAHAATHKLTRFRAICRDVTVRRGVRVAKWLGDGVMLVGTSAGPVIATVAELFLRFDSEDIDIHAGIAAGTVLLFEGDDYIGRPVNLAARLCEAAAANEILASGLDDALPQWVERQGSVTVRAVGIGDVPGVSQLRATADAWLEVPTTPTAGLALVDPAGDD
ncbi:MAG: hypothetical protein R2698_10150 [Microthrixaceae bacterium]